MNPDYFKRSTQEEENKEDAVEITIDCHQKHIQVAIMDMIKMGVEKKHISIKYDNVRGLWVVRGVKWEK